MPSFVVHFELFLKKRAALVTPRAAMLSSLKLVNQK